MVGGGQRRHVITHIERRHPHRQPQGHAPLAGGRVERGLRARRRFAAGQIGEELFHQRAYLLRGHVTGDHQGGVAGHVEAVIPIAGLLRLQLGQLVAPADDRVGVAGAGPRHRLEFFPGQRRGLVVGALAALFHHHLQFAAEGFVVDLQVFQALRLQFQGQRQPRRLVLLEIGGEVVAGEGVVAAAEAGHGARKLAGVEPLAALEHHVLEHMGQAGFIGGLINAARLEPDHDGDHRRPVILAYQHVEAVIELELVGRQFGAGGERDQAQPQGDQQWFHPQSSTLFMAGSNDNGRIAARP